MSQTISRKRTGSRSVKRLSRREPLPARDRPVQPGLSGGCFKPLSDKNIQAIHHGVIEVLPTIGMSQATPSCVELVLAKGGTYTEQGRRLFPQALIDKTLHNVLCLSKRDQQTCRYKLGVADRNSPKEWVEKGRPKIINTARRVVDAVLSTHYPEHIRLQLHAKLLETYSLKLDVNQQQSRNQQETV